MHKPQQPQRPSNRVVEARTERLAFENAKPFARTRIMDRLVEKIHVRRALVEVVHAFLERS